MKLRELFEAYGAIQDLKERVEFACQFPALLSSRLLPGLKADLDQEQDQSVTGKDRKQRLIELDSLRAFIAEDATRYRAGVGPVEVQAKRVADGQISLAAAMAAMRVPEFAMHLAPLYVHVLIFHAENLATGGDAAKAVLWARLLAEACLAANPAGDVNHELEVAGIGWIQIAGVGLAEMPDGEMLQHASRLGRELIERLAAPAELHRQAEVFHALGSLYSDPISSSSGAGTNEVENRVWLRRLETDKGSALAHEHRRQFPIPDRKEMLATAAGYFERALPHREGPPRGETLKALAQTLVFLARCTNTPVDAHRVKALCMEALDLLPPDNRHHQPVLVILSSLGASDELHGGADSIRSQASATAPADTPHTTDTPDRVLQRAQPLAGTNPAEALAMLDNAADLFKARASEGQRSRRLRFMIQLIPEAYLISSEFAADTSIAGAINTVAQKAEAENWSTDRQAAALIALATRTAKTNEELLGLRLVLAATEMSPTIARYRAPISFLLANLMVGVAVNAFESGNLVVAVQHYAQALIPNIRLGMPARTIELLDLIADLAASPKPEMAWEVVKALAPVALEIERELGAPGAEALQAVYRNACAGLGETMNRSVMSMLLQLAKGMRYSTMLREGVGFDWRTDETAVSLHRDIRALQEQLPTPDQHKVFDEVALVSAVASISAAAGDSPRERLENARHKFHRHVTARMTAATPHGAMLQPEALQQMLGPRTALLDYFFARTGEQDWAVYILVYTDRSVVPFCNVLPRDDQVMIAGSEGSTAVLDPIGWRTYRLRAALQLDPGAAPMGPEAQQALNEDFQLLVGTRTWEYLETLRAAGKDHLCIRPYGALRYYPLHLLGTQGTDLAQNWIVTSIPSLESLMPRQSAPRQRRGRALGLTYRGGKPFNYPQLLNAQSEVESVAKVMNTTPLLDAEVTEDRLLDALKTASRVHICAHGANDANSPLFHHLVVTPSATSDGRICAYEILGHDLRGLEVLSLGSCDSALGRFDAGDNLSGLPAALLAAGTSSIVASLWEMLDDAAAAFFVRFYQRLEGGASRLDAFRDAQLAARAAYPQARDWAGFCFLGSWNESDSHSDPTANQYMKLE